MKKIFSETLKELRMAAGYTQKQVYEMIGVPQSTFSSWEIGKAEPSADILLKLCEIYHVDNILTAFGYDGYKEDGSIQLSVKEIEHIEKYRDLDDHGKETVDIILDREAIRTAQLQTRDNKKILHPASSPAAIRIYTYMHKIASAGVGFYFDDIPTDTIEAPYMEGADFIIGVNGDSMEPTYYDGDLVYVSKKQAVEIGDIGIFLVNGECYIKEAGKNELVSHNSDYPTIPGNEKVLCIGKVLGKVQI